LDLAGATELCRELLFKGYDADFQSGHAHTQGLNRDRPVATCPARLRKNAE
jgi:hypothetical protein